LLDENVINVGIEDTSAINADVAPTVRQTSS